MTSNRDKLSNMLTRVAAGTVTREEGAMLLNSMAREDLAGTLAELYALIETPPANVKPQTVLLTVAQARNKAFFEVMARSLADEREEVAMLAAEELGASRSEAARRVLAERLDSDGYKARRAAAAALAAHFGAGAVETLKAHVLASGDRLYRLTSACGLLKAGPRGLSALVELMNAGPVEAAAAAAEAIAEAPESVPDPSIPLVIDALFRAGDAGDDGRIMMLLKAVSAFKARAAGFSDSVRAFRDHGSEAVREEASQALRLLGASS